MKTNGDTRPALEKCSCSIDVIASILPYDRYIAAETFLSLSQVPGGLGLCSNRLNRQEWQSTSLDAHRPKARYAVFDCPVCVGRMTLPVTCVCQPAEPQVGFVVMD
jgi:hypothetical protein